MSESQSKKSDLAGGAPPSSRQDVFQKKISSSRQELRLWWFKLLLQPLLLLAAGAVFLFGLGVAQKMGWFAAGSADGAMTHTAQTADEGTRYICPMMCTPPQSEPGRCPVCAMELVPAASGGPSDSRSVNIDPVARRLAHIHTVSVERAPMNRVIRAVGELSYDEGSLKTLAAYVDGRLEKLYADYTGVVVKKGDHLALVYSPRLYSAQVEYLLSKKAFNDGRSSSLQRVVDTNSNLYQSAKQRLIELGMTEPQIGQLESEGEANSRLHLCAPIDGTVIEKHAVEGQYVKEGQVIYQLADLSTVWLMLELFPEDAATIHYGQKVEAVVQSLPGKTFAGRVAFVDPVVDAQKRTVGVRVVIPNPDGLLRVGDYAKASVRVPMEASDGDSTKIYDSELAGKWISPRHPQIVRSEPGKCPVCGIELVPAAEFGFADEPLATGGSLIVPRSAVLMNGGHSVVYVESEPGKFEIRNVTIGAKSGDQVVVLDGLKEGESVATSGNFLIDSQMQLAGNPSLIDPMKGEPTSIDGPSPEILAALSKLSEEDRKLAERQRVCPVTMYPLGSMGPPPMVEVNGQTVFLCCEGCREPLLADPKTHMARLAQASGTSVEEESIPAVPEIGDMQLMIEAPSAEEASRSNEMEAVR